VWQHCLSFRCIPFGEIARNGNLDLKRIQSCFDEDDDGDDYPVERINIGSSDSDKVILDIDPTLFMASSTTSFSVSSFSRVFPPNVHISARPARWSISVDPRMRYRRPSVTSLPVFHPDFRRRPFDGRQEHPEMRFRNLLPDLVGSAEEVWVLDKEFACGDQRPARNLKRLTFQDKLIHGHCVKQLSHGLERMLANLPQ
jgi:hypothetical protein